MCLLFLKSPSLHRSPSNISIMCSTSRNGVQIEGKHLRADGNDTMMYHYFFASMMIYRGKSAYAIFFSSNFFRTSNDKFWEKNFSTEPISSQFCRVLQHKSNGNDIFRFRFSNHVAYSETLAFILVINIKK